MSQMKVNLANVRIASPCPKKWEEMVGDERVRFCSHCQLYVYNFSAMTKAEAESFLMKAEGRVCGKFYQRADGTMLTQDCPVGLRLVRQRVSKFAATAFSAIVGLLMGQSYNSGAFAQQKSQSKADIQRSLRRNGQPSIKGTIADEMRALIAGGVVTVINQQTKEKYTARTDSDGQFRFFDLQAGEYEIEFGSPGFIKFSVSKLSLAESESITFDTILKVGGEVMGDLVVLPEVVPTNDVRLPTTLERKKP